MILAIDASRANKDNKTGTEWYSYYVIEELKKIVNNSSPLIRGRLGGGFKEELDTTLSLFSFYKREKISVFLYTNAPLKGKLGVMPNNWQEKILNWPPKYLWTQIRLWWELLIQPPDVLLVPAHTIPFLPVRKKIKVLVTVHDVGFKRFPRLYKPIQVWYHDLTMRKIKNRADTIITISEFSKREIIDLYGVNPQKIKVIYPAYNREKYNQDIKTPAAEFWQKYNICRPYLLYVGRLEKKKNIGNIIKAFAFVKDKQPDLKLVLAGSGGNEYEAIKKIIFDLKLEKEIILPGYINSADLPLLMSQAEIFLFPTFYEGFGLPILEAMACATPVIISAREPHQEVAGGAGVFVNPRQAEEIAKKISLILGDDEFKKDLIAKGLKRAEDFSWEKTGRGIWDIIVTGNR